MLEKEGNVSKKTNLCLSIIFIVTLSSRTIAKSVYAIIDYVYGDGVGAPSKIASYDINDSQMDLQTVLTLDNSEPNYPTGGESWIR